MSYHQFKDPVSGVNYGSFEVFEVHASASPSESFPNGPGFYWWACFPGCMPDGEANGPFPTEQDAINDAKERE